MSDKEKNGLLGLISLRAFAAPSAKIDLAFTVSSFFSATMVRIRAVGGLSEVYIIIGMTIVGVCALALGITSLVFAEDLRRAALTSTTSPSAPEGTPTGFLDAASCCRYTHPDLPSLIDALRTFRQRVMLGNGLVSFEFYDWSYFQSASVDLETPFATNTYLQSLVALRARVLAVMAGNSDSLEDIQLRHYLNDLDVILNLTAIDAYFMQTSYAYGRGGFLNDPWIEAKRTLDSLPFRTGEASFATAVPAWLASLDAKATRWIALAQRSLAAGKVHANYTLVKQYNITVDNVAVNDGYYFAFNGNYTDACVLAALSGPSATACFASAASLMTKLGDLHDWWTGTYMPAAATLRPDSAPGLRNVANGTEIYDILQRYHVGVARTGAQLEVLSDARFAELTGELSNLAQNLLGNVSATADDLIAAYRVLTDTRFHQCSSDRSAAEAAFTLLLADSRFELFETISGLTDPIVEAYADGYTTYYVGDVNASTGVWDSTAEFYYFYRPNCNVGNPLQVAYPVAEYRSLIASEIAPGRGLAQAAVLEMDCSFRHTMDSVQQDMWLTFPTWRSGNIATLDGWAQFADWLVRYELGTYTGNAPSQTGSLYRRARYDLALKHDTCLHAAGLNTTCSLQQVRARMMQYGFITAGNEMGLEALLSAPAAGLATSSGEQLLRDQFVRVRSNITSASNLEFVRLFVRFGMPDVARDFNRLVDVFVTRTLNGTNAVPASAFGADLIPSQSGPSVGRPVVGVAREITCFV